jgi:penicillin amidase
MLDSLFAAGTRSKGVVRGRLLPVWLIFLYLAPAACSREPASPPPVRAQLSGTLELSEVSAPVRIVRDRWGVPHIYAESQDDLFFAQGFVQAEDRLFQMDLWRRSAQGRLSQVLGPNFIERDAMTRRVQYRGNMDAEWASYGADANAIATSFVRGINAWVALARVRPPEEFRVAGWTPDFWSPTDLLNRTDSFMTSGDAIDEVRRMRLSDVVEDALHRVGTPPFFVALAAPVPQIDGRGRLQPDVGGGNPRLRPSSSGQVSVTRGGPLRFSEEHRALDHPSSRYFVHLHAPRWNVIGATRPWLPGVAVGHNDRVAWAMAPFDADTEDVYVEPLASPGREIVKERIVVKGRTAPFDFDWESTRHGMIVASDREGNRAFAVRWSGTQPGAAAELGALMLDRGETWPEFRSALAAWKMPARQVVYADASGNIGFQAAAFVPVRRGGEWHGWLTIEDLPHAFNPAPGRVTITSPSTAPSPSSAASGALFAHTLGITAAARNRFNIGPLASPPGDDNPVRGSFDPASWDRSRAMNAPGQSESPDSPFFRDLATAWSQGIDVPLAFTDAAVNANASSTLILSPRR